MDCTIKVDVVIVGSAGKVEELTSDVNKEGWLLFVLVEAVDKESSLALFCIRLFVSVIFVLLSVFLVIAGAIVDGSAPISMETEAHTDFPLAIPRSVSSFAVAACVDEDSDKEDEEVSLSLGRTEREVGSDKSTDGSITISISFTSTRVKAGR